MNFAAALKIAYPTRSDLAAFDLTQRRLEVNAAREAFIRGRVKEMLADPEAIIIMSRYLIAAHPAKFGNVINDVMRERVGSLAALLDMMDKAAEDVAQEEWITPIREDEEMSEHTKEPWSVGHTTTVKYASGEGSEVSIHYGSPASRGNCIAIAYGHSGFAGSEADARRIVACVNACAGIPIDMLEAMPSGQAALLPMYARLEQQRNELAKNADRYTKHCRNPQVAAWCGIDPNSVDVLEQLDAFIDAALAKVGAGETPFHIHEAPVGEGRGTAPSDGTACPTELGTRLLELRQRYIAAGGSLYTLEEINNEVSAVRGRQNGETE